MLPFRRCGLASGDQTYGVVGNSIAVDHHEHPEPRTQAQQNEPLLVD
jgi:hypothetical protein